MKQEKVYKDNMLLVGISTRTNNKNELDPKKAKIGNFSKSYWENNTSSQFANRLEPGVTYAIYTDFESDENGDYTYFIGETVENLDKQDMSNITSLTIPKSTYHKFTTDIGEFPDIVVNSWKKIWKMKKENFLGERSYIADFEIYDSRAADPKNAVIDIYIGIK